MDIELVGEILTDKKPVNTQSFNTLKLKDCCVKITDGSHFSPKSVEKGYPYVTVKDMKDDKIDLNNCLQISEEDYKELVKNGCKPQINDLLFSKDGTVGKVSLIENESDFVLLSSVAILRPDTEILYPKYLFHVLKSRAFLDQALNQKRGVAIRRIVLRDLKELTLSVPPINTQKQIVSKIEELFSELDKGIEELKTAQQQLKVYRQAVLKWAFEGKLTNENVKEGELPEGWELREIKSVCSNIKVGIVIKPTQFYSTSEDGVRAFRSANVREFQINDSDWVHFSKEGNEINYRTKLKAGDVLLVRSGYPGTSCVVSKKFEDSNAIDILIATPNREIITSEYLCCFNNSPLGKGLFRSNSRGVAQKHLNVGEYSRLKISVPPIEEQQQIVQEIESRLSVCDKIEETINDSLKQAEALRQSILKKAFEGNLLTNIDSV